MVDLIPIRKLYVYEKLEQINTSEGRVYGDDKLPSVTRILSVSARSVTPPPFRGPRVSPDCGRACIVASLSR